MLNIELFRTDPDVVRRSQRRRHEDEGVVDRVIELDTAWRKSLNELNELRRRRNETARAIADKKKKKEDASAEIASMKDINAGIKRMEEEVERYKNERDTLLRAIPNLIHDTVPDGESEEDNVPIRFWGRPKVVNEDLASFNEQTGGKMEEYILVEKRPVSHVDILENSGLADFARAAKVAGSRFYYIKDAIVLLDLALQHFALDFMRERGYTPVLPPFMLNRVAYEGVTDLGTFEDTLYKVEDEDLYLIATSEHPLASMYMNEIIEPEELPIKMAGLSPCFRKEAGAHGKDTKGIFRVHQFNKVEQFVYCRPEDSWKYHEETIANAEAMFQALGIPYRVVNICAGDLGAVASKKYDLEAWMPVQGRFREMVSSSNALDYQARRLMIRYRTPEGTDYPHTVNSTAIATSRAIVAILENFQTEDGSAVVVPEALRKYTGFDEIPLER